MSNRRLRGAPLRKMQSRQTDIDDFKRLTGGDLMTWLVGTGEALDDAPLLERARQWWLLTCRERRCICCAAPLHEVDDVGGVLMAAPMHACEQISVSGVCKECWRTQSSSGLEKAARRTLRAILPRGRWA